jgi:hypothetical protein
MPLFAPSSGLLTLQDEGTPLGTIDTVNFVGAPVTATIGGQTGTVTVTGAGSTLTAGTATLNFGAWPGSTDASVAVTGQTGIGAGSRIWVGVAPVATSEHSIDEHMVDGPMLFVGIPSAGVGFTIYGMVHDMLGAGNNINVSYPPFVPLALDYNADAVARPTRRCYGNYSVWWMWV